MDYRFRGKYKDNGMWVYGSLIDDVDKCLIYVYGTGQTFEVIPETVGQYSTIEDQAMNDIYEGDVIKVAGRLLKVVFEAGCFLSLWGTSRYRLNQWGSEGVQVVGNIYDNPELLNPPADSPAPHTMQNLDPNVKQAEVTETEVEQVPAPTAGEAKENAEEGTTEG